MSPSPYPPPPPPPATPTPYSSPQPPTPTPTPTPNAVQSPAFLSSCTLSQRQIVPKPNVNYHASPKLRCYLTHHITFVPTLPARRLDYLPCLDLQCSRGDSGRFACKPHPPETKPHPRKELPRKQGKREI